MELILILLFEIIVVGISLLVYTWCLFAMIVVMIDGAALQLTKTQDDKIKLANKNKKKKHLKVIK